MAMLPVDERVEVREGGVILFEQLLGQRTQRLAGWSQSHFTRMAIEETCADARFDELDTVIEELKRKEKSMDAKEDSDPTARKNRRRWNGSPSVS